MQEFKQMQMETRKFRHQVLVSKRKNDDSETASDREVQRD